MKQGLVRLLYNLGKVRGVDFTHDNVCSSMLSCFYSHLLSTGRPISSFLQFFPLVGTAFKQCPSRFLTYFYNLCQSGDKIFLVHSNTDKRGGTFGHCFHGPLFAYKIPFDKTYILRDLWQWYVWSEG